MISYKSAGVDIKLSDKFTEFLEKKSKAIGGFAGLFDIKDFGMDYSIVASTDGVGTKLKLAFLLDRHNTIGIDLVAMCVNDLITCGAKPLFFLDYYATGKLELKKSREIIEGIIEGCNQSGMVLLGGETAEMPGFYNKNEYDLAGFAVGIVQNSKVIDGSRIKPGDSVIGLKSSGFHSNGYSLIRKVFGKNLKKYADELLEPTIIYVKQIDKIRNKLKKYNEDILGMAHITGSGIAGNLERILPKNVDALVYKESWEVPEIMKILRKTGNISENEMYKTFNMGIGFIIIVRKKMADVILKENLNAVLIGEIKKGSGRVLLNKTCS